MQKILLPMMILGLSFLVMRLVEAKEVVSTIESIEKMSGAETLVKAGLIPDVLWISKENDRLANDLILAQKAGSEIKLFINDDNFIEDFLIIPNSVNDVVEEDKFFSHLEDFTPTNLTSLENAEEFFKLMNPNTRRRSQCFNRAHIWSYNWDQRYQLKSQKVFIFFTSRYIRKFKYKWWFHVSPYVMVNGEEKVMDREFTNGPLTMRDWTDFFMKNDAFCPQVNKYSDYRNHQATQDCYLIKTSMYYWEPTDIERLEQTGERKTRWFMRELEIALKQAFRD